MQLIADRFAVDDRGHAIDLATGERVSVVVSTAGGPTEQARWAERCAWFARLAHPSLAQLVDYGVLAETQRFEAWAAQSLWPGAAAAAEQALARACRFLVANSRSPGAGAVGSIGCRAERPVLLPDASAGLPADVAGAAEVDADPALLGVLRHHDRRLAALGDIFSAGGTDRLPALALWAPEGGGMPAAVRVMARSARLAGYVPLNAALHSDAVRPLLEGRTLAVFAHDDVEGGWRAVLDAALDVSRPHIVIFAGAAPVRRVHTVPLERVRAEALQASVCPEAVAMKQRRAVATAARRAQGLAGRFEQLLFGQARAPVPAPAADRRRPSEAVRGGRGGRAAEQTTAFDEAHGMASRSDDSARRWPAPGEVTRLRRQLDAARAALRRGRCQPGERAARQAMHGFARRGEWLGALQCALCLIESLLRRGRLTDAEPLLDEARRWGSLARELGGLQRLSVLHAELLIASGRLPAAELLLETTLASAQSAGPEAPLDVLRRRYCIPQVQLHDSICLDLVTDPQRAARGIEAENAPDQEVATSVLVAVARGANADIERFAEQLAVSGGQAFEDCAEDLSWNPSVEFADQVVVRARHEQRITDRSAALRERSPHFDIARHRQGDHARAIDAILQVQRRRTGLPSATRKAADLGAAGKRAIQSLEKRIRGKAERVCQQQERGIFMGADLQRVFPHAAFRENGGHIGYFKMGAAQFHVGQHGRSERQARSVFQLPPTADHAAGTATEQKCGVELPSQQRPERCELGQVFRTDERDEQVRFLAIEAFEHLSGRLLHGCREIRVADRCRCPLHGASPAVLKWMRRIPLAHPRSTP